MMTKVNMCASSLFSSSALILSAAALFWSMALLANQEYSLEWQAGAVNSYKIVLLLIVDWMSLFFLSVVLLISGSVILFSATYMVGEAYFSRFIFLVLLFISSMVILILSPNLISILLGWDGLGVTSYLLVIYFQSEKSFNAGMITALTNRLGDAGIIILVGLSFNMGSASFLFYSNLSGVYSEMMILVVILVSMTKSAQVPFSAWLPAAMAAPTPVSALVHSSTLVTAGAYLLIRMNYILVNSGLLSMLMLIGSTTMVMAGASALGEVDMKKIIALSTLSQLGLMFLTLGMGLPSFAFFHLVAHAYFKAMMFMAAGSVIHSMKDYQDLRTMSAGGGVLPVAASIFSVASLSLCGMPFMTGFFSKDAILELLFMSESNLIIFLMSLLATSLTVLYSLRVMWFVFSGTSLSEPYNFIQEGTKAILAGPLILIMPSVFGGMLISWAMGSQSYLIFLPEWLKFAVAASISVGAIMFKFLSFNSSSKIWGRFWHYMWFMPALFSRSAARQGMVSSSVVYKCSESSWLSMMLIYSVARSNVKLSNYSFYSMKAGFLKSLPFLLGLSVFL